MDWQVGDLAVCVDARPGLYGPSSLVEGRCYTVAEVLVRANPIPSGIGPSACGLLFIEIRPADPTDIAFAAARFRKIRPDEHENCEPEFVELLKRSKKRVSA
jgi:hypothetical protein